MRRSQSWLSGFIAGNRVLNAQNLRRGVASRRGDGTFGELVPGVAPFEMSGFKVARGPVATIEIGTEVKILAKAMIKQIDRVMGDLVGQVRTFRGATATDLRRHRRHQSCRSLLFIRARSGVGDGRQETQTSN